MFKLKLTQLQYESDAWKRLLAFMMDENVYLKNRVAEVLGDGFNNDLLDSVENFQTRFIKIDECINLLRNNVAELDKLLMREVFEDGKIVKEVGRKLHKLRADMMDVEKQFGRLKHDFNSYLSENIV
ncbi:hypothetical protein FRZ67_00135 [Panacibacter ginsenosidivorans]|uniref:Uncharacterized protein n=1 Tax=Panacibacter ginsenosidivorans TaxID=1813871 RepID=A0A5B8V5C0_9BACT|nr:hypothetical protein [Panacibacter ginsenosidivorans]QEC65786.1 hypothetical protein FRZ67_00135 [Panacibacter ginsenosidivorans]